MALPPMTAVRSLSSLHGHFAHVFPQSAAPGHATREDGAVVQQARIPKLLRRALTYFGPNAYDLLTADETNTDPDSRLGAFVATRGYSPGQVGLGVHNSIGGIYLVLGPFGEAQIGRLFNSLEARQFYSRRDEEAHLALAQREYDYWRWIRAQNPLYTSTGFGGLLGSLVTPHHRVKIQSGLSFPALSREKD